MKLMIRSVAMSDYGSYKCISKNSLGETDGSIKLYREYIPVIQNVFILVNGHLYNANRITRLYSCPHYYFAIYIDLQINDSVRFNLN